MSSNNTPTPPLPPPCETGSAPSCGTNCLYLAIKGAFYAMAALALLIGTALLWAIASQGPLEENKTLIIPKGASVHEIATLLDKNGIIHDPIAFRVAARLMASNNLQAGEYLFSPQLTTANIIDMLREGKAIFHFITLAEGLTTQEILDILNAETALTGDITTSVTEGSLLPETYRYSYGDQRNALIERMKKMQQDVLNDLWDERDAGIPLKTSREAVIMASVIEKETGRKAEERPRVAGVFYNRYKIGMRLQSDPTVIYALTNGKKPLDRNLTRSDLTTPSPYNTYVNVGLPPTPICNPGKAALHAALHPETHPYFYFVADGTGGHVFAKELPEHNKNVSNRTKLIKATKEQKKTAPK